jgi:hypothetical protein
VLTPRKGWIVGVIAGKELHAARTNAKMTATVGVAACHDFFMMYPMR